MTEILLTGVERIVAVFVIFFCVYTLLYSENVFC